MEFAAEESKIDNNVNVDNNANVDNNVNVDNNEIKLKFFNIPTTHICKAIKEYYIQDRLDLVPKQQTNKQEKEINKIVKHINAFHNPELDKKTQQKLQRRIKTEDARKIRKMMMTNDNNTIIPSISQINKALQKNERFIMTNLILQQKVDKIFNKHNNINRGIRLEDEQIKCLERILIAKNKCAKVIQPDLVWKETKIIDEYQIRLSLKPDGILIDKDGQQTAIIEIKNRESRQFQVRLYERLQVIVYLKLLNLKTCYFVQFITGNSNVNNKTIIIEVINYSDNDYKNFESVVEMIFGKIQVENQQNKQKDNQENVQNEENDSDDGIL